MGETKCGCWTVLKTGLKGTYKSSSSSRSSKDTANALPRTSLVYDAATETRYLNASNRELSEPHEVQLPENSGPPAIEEKAFRQLLQFTFQELKSATGNFRPDSILGEGGFGFVFKGWVEENGTAPARPGSGVTVAIKSLKPDALQGHREWVAEVDFLGQLHHPNLVKLIGYCIEDDQRLLVYEFMTRGSLENHLFRSAGYDDEKSLLMSQMSLEKRFGQSTVFVASTLMENGGVPQSAPPDILLKEAIHVISCGYEDKSDWGQEIGWIYGSVTEDILTGFKMHARGWRSIYCMPDLPAFKGSAPINLSDRLNQVLRWALGSVEILLSRYCLFFSVGIVYQVLR